LTSRDLTGAAGEFGPGSDGADPVPAAVQIVADFLAERPAAVDMVTRWARSVAEHRAWGFESPDDIVQSTLLALVRNFRAGRFHGDELRPYVRRITKNLCISSYRRARRYGRELRLSDDPAGADDEHAPVQLVAPELDAESRTLLNEIMQSLDESCRHLVALAYIEGLSRQEIAQELGISAGAARVRLHRCIAQARQLVAEQEGTP
jgi:RNA polymerase sigma-70 factor (ECF subfamily)